MLMDEDLAAGGQAADTALDAYFEKYVGATPSKIQRGKGGIVGAKFDDQSEGRPRFYFVAEHSEDHTDHMAKMVRLVGTAASVALTRPEKMACIWHRESDTKGVQVLIDPAQQKSDSITLAAASLAVEDRAAFALMAVDLATKTRKKIYISTADHVVDVTPARSGKAATIALSHVGGATQNANDTLKLAAELAETTGLTVTTDWKRGPYASAAPVVFSKRSSSTDDVCRLAVDFPGLKKSSDIADMAYRVADIIQQDFLYSWQDGNGKTQTLATDQLRPDSVVNSTKAGFAVAAREAVKHRSWWQSLYHVVQRFVCGTSENMQYSPLYEQRRSYKSYQPDPDKARVTVSAAGQKLPGPAYVHCLVSPYALI